MNEMLQDLMDDIKEVDPDFEENPFSYKDFKDNNIYIWMKAMSRLCHIQAYLETWGGMNR